MKHRCRTCLHEFSDDGGPLPYRDRVHCVLCGAAIPLPRAHAQTDLPPFSNEAAREADFALGVLNAAGNGFPDTLRQFRVRQPARPRPSTSSSDTLMPLTGVDETVTAAAPARWWGVSFWASLGMGFAVGGLLAYGFAVSHRGAEPSRGTAQASARLDAPTQPELPKQAPLPSSLGSAAVASLPAPGVALPAPGTTAALASPKPAPRIFDAMAERRFALERARAEQRSYHLAEAERLYARILARSPHDSEALAGLGELELLRGTTDLAAARFRDALSANADYVPARIAVADLEWQAGHVEAARQAYREIVQAYTADLYPPYVAQRSQVGEPANCDQ